MNTHKATTWMLNFALFVATLCAYTAYFFGRPEGVSYLSAVLSMYVLNCLVICTQPLLLAIRRTSAYAFCIISGVAIVLRESMVLFGDYFMSYPSLIAGILLLVAISFLANVLHATTLTIDTEEVTEPLDGAHATTSIDVSRSRTRGARVMPILGVCISAVSLLYYTFSPVQDDSSDTTILEYVYLIGAALGFINLVVCIAAAFKSQSILWKVFSVVGAIVGAGCIAAMLISYAFLFWTFQSY